MAEFFVAFWNVENLFDIENAPATRRSDKLRRVLASELKGWTQAQLNRKVSQLASVIREMNGGAGPDLLGVCEIENRHVLDLLVAELAGLGRDYRVAHADTKDRRGIDVAFIFDARLFEAQEQFSHFIVKRLATRELFQVNFKTKAAPKTLLVAVGNHWPSRLGGQYESEPFRIIAAETLAYFHERIREIHGPDVGVVAMGDFNDEPSDRSLEAHALSQRTRAKVTRARSAAFLNLMWEVLGDGLGTHYFSNEPQVIDQFLVSKGLLTGNAGLQVVPGSVQVIRPPRMIGPGTYPVPVRTERGKTFNPNGFSDHYPIAMLLRR